jgi:hypothetical protein
MEFCHEPFHSILNGETELTINSKTLHFSQKGIYKHSNAFLENVPKFMVIIPITTPFDVSVLPVQMKHSRNVRQKT